MGFGVVKIPQQMFKSVKVNKRYEYAVYKVAYYEDQIMEILYEKKHSIQILLYLLNNMNCPEPLSKHYDEMVEMIDSALRKTEETNVKRKITVQKDVDEDLIEHYNNGWIDVNRL